MKYAKFILFLLLSSSCLGQLSKTHYIPPLTYSNETGVSPEDQYIDISTPSLTNVKFKIKEIGGDPNDTITYKVKKTTPVIFPIGNRGATRLFVKSANTFC